MGVFICAGTRLSHVLLPMKQENATLSENFVSLP